jgi:zinc ribbon protein
MNCHACGTPLAATARFCHKCGAAVAATAGGAAGWRGGLPWAAAGAALGALVTVLALRIGASGERGAVADAASEGTPDRSRLAASAPDISRMSPEERARRLFDRVVGLAERGIQDSVRFFLPMALGAYAQLPALDLDARYDIGALHLAGGDGRGALAQADTILRAVPTHLYGFMLRARAADLARDAVGARRAYAGFLRHEATERAHRRPEYAEHQNTIDAFHVEAVRVTGGKAS